MATNDQFRKDFAKIIEHAKGNASTVYRYVAQDLLKNFVVASPVGDPSGWQSPPPAGYAGGRLKNNWMVGDRAINTTTTNAPDAVGAASLNDGFAAINSLQLGGTIYITNSLPYAKALEYGHSKQAPHGMVRIGVQNLQRSVRDAVQGLKK